MLAFITDFILYIFRPLLGNPEASEARRRNERSLSLKLLVEDRKKTLCDTLFLNWPVIGSALHANFAITADNHALINML